MINEVRICDKCRGFNHEKIISRLKKFDYKFNFVIGCQNFCGIGSRKSFLILNNIPIIADNEDELINKVLDELKKRSF